jgi:blue copper oxidase
MKFKVVAVDGGFLNHPLVTDAVGLGAAERVEIVVDLNDLPRKKDGSLADGVQLVSYAFDPLDPKSALGAAASGGAWSGGTNDADAWKKGPKPHRSRKEIAGAKPDVEFGRPPAGYGFNVLQLATAKGIEDSGRLGKAVPQNLRQRIPELAETSTLKATSPYERTLRLEGPGTDDKDENPREIDFAATINDRRFDMNKILAGDIESQVRIEGKLGDHEIWHIRNEAGDMMHPFHIHGRQFRVLKRSSGPLTLTDVGLKDTVQVFPGETVDVLLDYSVIDTYDGKPSMNLFYYHCHVLEHEDMGMMGIFRVGAVAKPSKDKTDYDTRTACDEAKEPCGDAVAQP